MKWGKKSLKEQRYVTRKSGEKRGETRKGRNFVVPLEQPTE